MKENPFVLSLSKDERIFFHQAGLSHLRCLQPVDF